MKLKQSFISVKADLLSIRSAVISFDGMTLVTDRHHLHSRPQASHNSHSPQPPRPPLKPVAVPPGCPKSPLPVDPTCLLLLHLVSLLSEGLANSLPGTALALLSV